mmetsp:Transcript_7647/g.11488  ORF Transcript_7647/g.11488 Transcript_7647/m.11488 type:complete len:171 (+) Transcript_7647:93-605(+)
MVLAVSTRGLAVPCARGAGLFATTRVAARKSVGTQLVTQQSNFFATSAEDRKKNRPVSPHVMIYSFPLAAVSSITTRITGSLLTVGLYGISYGALLGADMPAFMSMLGSSGIGPFVKFSVAFPLIYHYVAGMRHFYWERKPEGLDPETQKNSSIAIYGVAGALSLVLSVV